MKKKLGVYAGSFNPFHLGHLNIAKQALDVFDKVIIAQGRNPSKDDVEKESYPSDNLNMKRFTHVVFGGLLSDYLNGLDLNLGEEYEIFLIRGLRDGEDLHYEQIQLQFIKDMYPSLKTVFFVCDRQFDHISSSALRQLKKISPEDYKKYILLNPPVEQWASMMSKKVYEVN